MDRLASITAFVRVAENGGFSAAARSLDVSTTTVSDQVQALENALGVRLLNRTTRRVGLTEIGREYYERCTQILHELEEADQAASALQQTPRGQLRVYCHQALAPPVGAVVACLLARYRETSVDLRTGDVMIDLLREGFDLAIMPTSPPDSTLVKRRLAVWRYVVCAAPAYLEKHAPPQSPADLAAHNCLLYTHSVFGHDWPFLDSDNNRVMVRVTGNLVTTSIVVMRAVVVAGLGLWLCPPYIVSDLLASGQLVRVLKDHPNLEMESGALYPHRRYMTAKVRVFIDMLVERSADEQRWLDAMPNR
jgi:DNA-binding transcriptional LysR family regulator